ncbi:hypothetical protein FHS82_002056 [Pseudochelatococcus lubricantis]|uniref:TIGR00725 family protein n=1 Tax=Pseudochelatococcus lubricantis TaxID=1538102 RepID=A0ABX0V0Y0_9HYPH|nr:TIGR00725 family protein [Pseudochelatococcus lubricantis]NIJ58214.1 hypothetical protein [Pseudochelatococcus lubricantis]
MSLSDRATPLSTPPSLTWSATECSLYRPGERFDSWRLSWVAEEARPSDLAAVASSSEALRLVFTASKTRRVPVGVIGPREASDAEYKLAEAVGRALGEHGLQLLCGGKSGVMEAACKGNLEAGGLPIGLLPDTEWRESNPYVAIPIATGIGPVRNAILARASTVLVAIGGGYGTLTEMAYGLHFDRPVLALGDAPFVEGILACETPGDVIAHIARHLLDNAPRAA